MRGASRRARVLGVVGLLFQVVHLHAQGGVRDRGKTLPASPPPPTAPEGQPRMLHVCLSTRGCLSWLGAIRPTSANDAFDPALWETFVSTTLGLESTIRVLPSCWFAGPPNVKKFRVPHGSQEVPILAALPRLHNSPLAKCGCKKFGMDFHGDHTSTCTAHSGATKAETR